jgi:hypothetical protein
MSGNRSNRPDPARVRAVNPVVLPAGRAAVSGTSASSAPGSGTKVRAYGAPLAGASRFMRPASRQPATGGVGTPHVDDADAGTQVLPELFLPESPGAPHGGPAIERAPADAGEAPPLILWEQPPYPKTEFIDQRPRWVVDVEDVPTVEEYAELASYLGYMLDGFSEMCRTPGVTTSGVWQARLPMPAAVLPDTVLDVHITAALATLRFDTEHPVSRELVSRYAAKLQAQVRKSLDGAMDVEVMLW